MKRLLPVCVLSLVACSGDEAVPVGPTVAQDVEELALLGPPEPPHFADAIGPYTVAWTTALVDANRPAPPLVAGTAVEVVALHGDTVTVRTHEDPPRTGTLPAHRLIAGARMRQGVLAEDAAALDKQGRGAQIVPVAALTAIMPYAARSGMRAIVDPDGVPRWISPEALRHEEGDIAVGRAVAAIRWHLERGDRRSAQQVLRGLPAAGEGSALVAVGLAAFASEFPGVVPVELADERFLDPATDLSWQRCAYGQGWSPEAGGCNGAGAPLTQERAVSACGGVRTEDGAWRLPTADELSSMLMCDAGFAGDGSTRCQGTQRRGALLQAFQVPAAVAWTATRAEAGGVVVYDLATGAREVRTADDDAVALCVTERFEGTTYVQTAAPLPTTRARVPTEGEVPVVIAAETLLLAALPLSESAGPDAPEPSDLGGSEEAGPVEAAAEEEQRVQVRTRSGVRWASRSLLVPPAFPIHAIPEEVVPIANDNLRPDECVQIYGPEDRITAGEDVRIIGSGAAPGSLAVEVERGCQGARGRTFRAIAEVQVRGPSFRVRSDAEDPCASLPERVPNDLREVLGDELPDHPALCAEYQARTVEPFFPGASSVWAVSLKQDVHVDATAFLGWVVDGQKVPGDVVPIDATYRARTYTLVATTESNALRRTEELVVYRATLFEWRKVDHRLKSGGGPNDEVFAFDRATGDLVGSLGLTCHYDADAVAYDCG